MRRLLRNLAILVVLIVGVTVTPGVAAASGPSPSATPDSQIAAYCKVVIAEDIRIFKSPTGTAIWGHYLRGAIFFVDRTDGDRYHTQIINEFVVDAWTTSDPRWVAPC